MRDRRTEPPLTATPPHRREGGLSGSILSVQKALRILEAFTPSEAEWGVRDLSLRLGLPKSVVHRLVQTLAQGGLLEQNPSSQKYHMGLRAFEIGRLYLEGNRFHREGLRILRDLAATTTYTCYLGVLDGPDAVALAVEYGSHPVRIVGAAGDRFPAHAVAFGKAMLATLPTHEVLARLGPAPLRQLTAATDTDLQQILADLIRIRRLGYAVAREETYPGVTSIGTPVYGPDGRAVAALSVSLTSHEVTPGQEEQLGAMMIRYADALAQRIPGGPGG